MGESSRPSVVMISLFIVILIAYLTYIMLLHPWDRKELLTLKAVILVNVIDCDSGYPIKDAVVKFYNDEGKLLSESTALNGSVSYSDLPDCYKIKTSYSNNITRVCVDSGENRVINLCYKHPEANPYVLFYKENIGLIGMSGGAIITNKSFGNVILSFPVSNYSLTYPSAFLYSNLLWGEGANFNITDIQPGITEKVDFNFVINSLKGTPIISVYLGKNLLYKERAIKDSKVSIILPKQELKNNITLRTKCNFNDWKFWTTQYCELTNITITQHYYKPQKVSQEFNFTASQFERQAQSITLNFTSSLKSAGGIKASINGVKIFDSKSLEPINYAATVNLFNLSENNNLCFEANPGAEVYLRGTTLFFKTFLPKSKTKEYEFKLSDEKINKLTDVKIDYYVSNIMLGGHINFNINGVVYVDTIKKAGWNQLIIDKEDLLNDNILRINSPDASFLIDKMRISYE